MGEQERRRRWSKTVSRGRTFPLSHFASFVLSPFGSFLWLFPCIVLSLILSVPLFRSGKVFFVFPFSHPSLAVSSLPISLDDVPFPLPLFFSSSRSFLSLSLSLSLPLSSVVSSLTGSKPLHHHPSPHPRIHIHPIGESTVAQRSESKLLPVRRSLSPHSSTPHPIRRSPAVSQLIAHHSSLIAVVHLRRRDAPNPSQLIGSSTPFAPPRRALSFLPPPPELPRPERSKSNRGASSIRSRGLRLRPSREGDALEGEKCCGRCEMGAMLLEGVEVCGEGYLHACMHGCSGGAGKKRCVFFADADALCLCPLPPRLEGREGEWKSGGWEGLG